MGPKCPIHRVTRLQTMTLFLPPLLYRTLDLCHLNESVHEGHRGLVCKLFTTSNVTLLRFKCIKCIYVTSYLPSCVKYLTILLLCKIAKQKLLSKQVSCLISPILQIRTQNMKRFQVLFCEMLSTICSLRFFLSVVLKSDLQIVVKFLTNKSFAMRYL